MENDVVINKNVKKYDLYYNEESMISITINYPSFESKKFKTFAKYLTNYYFSKLVLHSKYEIYKLYILAQSEYEYAMDNDFPFRRFEYYLDYEVTYNANCTISLYYDTYTYTGGAHGSTIKGSDTWNIQECKWMPVTDYIVETDNYREFLINEIINTIEEVQGTDEFIYFEDYEQLVENTFQKDSFYLVDEGIVIYFQQYDIAPYSSGMPTFLIPYENTNIISPYCK